MSEPDEGVGPLALAQAVREACVQAVLEAWEEGGMSGLCAEGRLELAVGALRALDLEALLARHGARGGSPPPTDRPPGA